MPRMDDIDFNQGKFKRTSVRSWDSDLLSSLKMDKETDGFTSAAPQKEEREEKEQANSTPTVLSKENEGISVKKISSKPVKDSSKGIEVFDGDKNIPFLNEDFRLTKLIKRLTGNEKKLFLLIIETCNAQGATKTGSIASEDIEEYLSLTRNSRESAIKRLCGRGIIKRNKGRRGVGGTINLSVSEKALEVVNRLIKEGELL
jgi:predicted transcriptional regulator